MNERQAKILASVVEEYTKTGLPVGSQIIVKKYLPEISPATVRNDMTNLEKEGLLHQTHISSGRIPTDKGYRFFVESLMKSKELSRREQNELQSELLKLRAKNVRMARTMAKLLSAMSGQIAMTGNIDQDEYYEFGLRNILESSDIEELDEMCRLVEVLDAIDEKVDALLDCMKDGETRIFIGQENPIREMSGYSMVVSPFRNKEGERGMIALIGPKRMEYAKNKSLIDFVKNFFSASSASVGIAVVGSYSVIF